MVSQSDRKRGTGSRGDGVKSIQMGIEQLTGSQPAPGMRQRELRLPARSALRERGSSSLAELPAPGHCRCSFTPAAFPSLSSPALQSVDEVRKSGQVIYSDPSLSFLRLMRFSPRETLVSEPVSMQKQSPL